MSDRVPKVTVDETFNSRWTATCHEPNCTWRHAPDEKTYVSQRAKAHRREHRKAADRG